MERGLPLNWRELLTDSVAKDPGQLEQWDGQLRCLNDHEPVVMDIMEPRVPQGMPFPVVSLEVAGMKMSIRKALDEYVLGLSGEIREAIDRACTPENVRAVIAREADAVLALVIREEVENFYRRGPGRKAVREAVSEKLGNPE